MPINCNQPNVYQYGESWTTEANEYHALCAAYRTTSLNTKYQETVAAAPADSHGGDHTAQFVAASRGGGGGEGGSSVFGAVRPLSSNETQGRLVRHPWQRYGIHNHRCQVST